jgi:hypothetical protein
MLLKDQSSAVRQAARAALESIYTHQIVQLGATNDALFAKLLDPLNALERPIAAHVLFSIALNSPARSQDIRRQLLSTARTLEGDPIAQVWINKTLALLDLADLAHSATSDIRQWDTIVTKLEHFSNLDNQYYYSPYNAQPASFIGNDFISAASEAHSWLDRRATREKN